MKEFWRFLNRREKSSPEVPGKQVSSTAHKEDSELKELIGQWVYDHLAGVAVAIANSKGIIKHFNGEAEALTSIPKNTAKGKYLGALFPTLSYDFRAQLNKTRPQVRELSFTDSKGTQKYFKATLGPLNDPLKGFIGFALVFQDITRQKEIEERLQLEEGSRAAKKRLLAEEQGELFGEGFESAGLIGQSREIRNVYHLIKRVGPTNTNILVTGETGTGKETVARAIHLNSLRRDKPFTEVNCGAISETLIEDDLFGHVRGAFTGAVSDRAGLIKQADRGTLFLEDIGALPLHIQLRLVRVLQEKAVIPVGGNKGTPVDVRLIAASQKDLHKEMESGRFRQELLYRLNVVHIRLPPLRERKEDLALLVQYFINKFGQVHNKQIEGISGEALMWLKSYDYPGNIWELENFIEHAVTVTRTNVITEEDLPAGVGGASILEEVALFKKTAPGGELAVLNKPVSLDDELAIHERCLLLAALKKANHVQKRAAELLGINYRSFRHRLEKYGLIEYEAND